VDCGIRIKQGMKKGQTNDVIPVGMGQKQITSLNFFLNHGFSKPADAGTGVNDHNLTRIRLDLKTGGIAAVLGILLP
jgi:hypothetical protein